MSSKLFVNSITGRTSEIIQVACVCGDEHFNVYLRHHATLAVVPLLQQDLHSLEVI